MVIDLQIFLFDHANRLKFIDFILKKSISNKNLRKFQTADGSSMCLELALEGERLCKSGDCNAGVAFFQVSITLSIT